MDNNNDRHGVSMSVFFISDLGYDRYKFVVQVVIGEQRGEGVK